MRLHHITLQNLRAFESLQIDLDERLTVLVGRNGAGKSTVLDGIAVALGAWLGAIPTLTEDFTFQKSWARLVKSEIEGQALAESSFPIRVEGKCQVGDGGSAPGEASASSGRK